MSDNGRIEVRDVMRFLHRALEKERPLTVVALDRFLHNPHGLVIPDDLLEVWRPPSACDCSVLPRRGDFAVSPDGKPCFVAVMTGKLVTVCGELVYVLTDAPNPADRACGGAVVECDSKREPITLLHDDGRKSDDPPRAPAESILRGRRSLLYRGSKCLVEERDPFCVQCAASLRDGRIVHLRVEYLVEEKQYVREAATLCLDAIPTTQGPASIGQLYDACIASDGTCYGIWSEVPESPYIIRRIGFDGKTTDLGRFGSEDMRPREIVETADGVGVLIEDDRSRTALYSVDGLLRRENIGRPWYSRHYAELPDGRVVYVTRGGEGDARKAFVVNGVRQPYAFDCVSKCFRSADGERCYWGAIGRTFCRMRVPTPTDAEVAAADAEE